MAESSIPVDLFNPGQVFACLGLLEITNQLIGNAKGAFDWNDAAKVRFRVAAPGEERPVERAITFLRNAVVGSITPFRIESGVWNTKWGTKPALIDPSRDAFPFPAPESPATFPAKLSCGDLHVELTHWGDDIASSGRDNVKFWAGAGGYPGAALARDALALIKGISGDIVADPLNAPARQSSSFRFDWRRDYVPMDIGFSLNKHGNRFCMVGYPVVEVLAAIGLSFARPKRVSKLEYNYGVLAAHHGSELLDAIFLRAALGTAPMLFAQRTFKMKLEWPGQENQARCITNVEELTAS